jgi:hypothetical protein
MKRQIKYISELNRSFDTAEEAIEDDNRLPGIIAKYEDDLRRMEEGLEMFGGSPVTEELKEQWRHAIEGYKVQWDAAQLSLENAEVSHRDRERQPDTHATPNQP